MTSLNLVNIGILAYLVNKNKLQMRLLSKQDRDAKQLVSFSDYISEDNEVRLIDAFVDKLDIISHGFVYKTAKTEGIQDKGGGDEYDPKDLIKLHLYGYLNKERSGRDLEKACLINMEVRWLLSGQQPSYVTICNFKKENETGFKQLFKTFNKLWKNQDLYGKETFAVDGTIIRGQNSKKKL